MPQHTEVLRSVRILDVVEEETTRGLQGSGPGHVGTDAGHIARTLGLDRANVSKLLNSLHRSGQLIKIQGHPTLYAHRGQLAEHFPDSFIPSILPDEQTLQGLFSKPVPSSAPNSTRTELERQIGWDGSLKGAILQAKAAVSYPPRGLHTLLVGNTGVGKSRFARQMFDYAKATGKLPEDSPFLIFNCQDYASSSQYLASQLFGYAKGMQGNEKSRKGAVEAAAGGILYLNDIQKLSPKVLELLITLVEKNVFSRLGESSVIRQANIMIVAATTEPPDSPVVLRLAQSIPVLIRLPEMYERGVSEVIQHLFLFFNREADNIKLPVRLHRDALACLAEIRYQGNISEMSSMVRIVCSQAYLEYSNAPVRRPSMEINCSHMPSGVTEAVNWSGPHTAELASVLETLEEEYILFTPEKETVLPTPRKPETVPETEPGSEPSDLFPNEMTRMGDYISQCVARLKSGVDAGAYNPEKLISGPIYEVVRKILETHEAYCCLVNNNSLQYGFLLHLRNALQRTANHIPMEYAYTSDMKRTNPKEYALACELRQSIGQAAGLLLPEPELDFIAMYLYLASKWSENSRVGLLAVFHGSHVAEALAEFINTCCGCNRVGWVNFPPQMSLKAVTEEAAEQAQKLDMGLGVLLLTDMEPLTSLHKAVTASTGIRTETLAGLSPSSLLTVAQKSMTAGFTLDTPLGLSVSNAPQQPDGFEGPGTVFMNRIIHEILTKSLTFLDPVKAAKALLASLSEILSVLGLPYSDAIAVKFIFHCSHMLERIIRNEPLKYVRLTAFVKQYGKLILTTEKALASTEEIFGISIPPCEMAYVVEIFLPYLNPEQAAPSLCPAK